MISSFFAWISELLPAGEAKAFKPRLRGESENSFSQIEKALLILLKIYLENILWRVGKATKIKRWKATKAERSKAGQDSKPAAVFALFWKLVSGRSEILHHLSFRKYYRSCSQEVHRLFPLLFAIALIPSTKGFVLLSRWTLITAAKTLQLKLHASDVCWFSDCKTNIFINGMSHDPNSRL